MRNNPYKTLGVKPGASEAEIHDAYRKRARECHPDLHPGDEAAEENFKRIAEAYAMLKKGRGQSLLVQTGLSGLAREIFNKMQDAVADAERIMRETRAAHARREREREQEREARKYWRAREARISSAALRVRQELGIDVPRPPEAPPGGSKVVSLVEFNKRAKKKLSAAPFTWREKMYLKTRWKQAVEDKKQAFRATEENPAFADLLRLHNADFTTGMWRGPPPPASPDTLMSSETLRFRLGTLHGPAGESEFGDKVMAAFESALGACADKRSAVATCQPAVAPFSGI